MTRHSVGIALREGGVKAGLFVASRPDWFLERISKLNMTNFRALTTIGLSVWTAWRYLTEPKWGTWEPSIEWLGFLLTLGGLDVVQFGVKRKTHRNGATDEPSTEGNPNDR